MTSNKNKGKSKFKLDKLREISEHIKTAVLKHNYQVDKVNQMLIRDFTDKELDEFDKHYG